MLWPPIPAKDRLAYVHALWQSHRMRVGIEILDQNEDHWGTIENRLISGQVDFDTSSDVQRTATLTFLDPDGRLQFEPDHPSESSVFAHRMIRITRGIFVPHLQSWVDRPVFWGPITGYDRNGYETTITCSGKEVLLRNAALTWRHYSFRKGTKITGIIKTILSDRGETRFDFAENDRAIHKHMAVTKHEEPWLVCQRLAHSINRQLFYDSRGRLRLRRFPENAPITFKDYGNANILTPPRVTYSLADVRNLIEVLGPETESKKIPRIRSVAIAPPSHPLSPAALKRNGKPLYLVESLGIDGPNPPSPPGGTKKGKHKKPPTHDEIVRFEKEMHHYHKLFVPRQRHAEEIAKHTLRSRLLVALDIQFEALPMPDLEELDHIVVVWNGRRWEFPLTQWTLPLTATDPMTVGTNRRVPQDVRRKSKKKRKKGGSK